MGRMTRNSVVSLVASAAPRIQTRAQKHRLKQCWLASKPRRLASSVQSEAQVPQRSATIPLFRVPGAWLSPRWGGREGYLSDLLLQRRWGGAVLGALGLTLAVAALGAGGGGGGGGRCGGSSGRAGDVGPAGVPQLLLLVPGLVLMFVVQHSLKVHYCPRVPGLGGARVEDEEAGAPRP